MPNDKAVVFVDNHDNQRGHGAGGAAIVTFWDSRYSTHSEQEEKQDLFTNMYLIQLVCLHNSKFKFRRVLKQSYTACKMQFLISVSYQVNTHIIMHVYFRQYT